MTDSHIGLVHVVRGGKVYPLNSGEPEVCLTMDQDIDMLIDELA